MWIIKNIIFIVIIIIFSTIFKSSSNSAMIGFYFIFIIFKISTGLLESMWEVWYSLFWVK